jgi:hypothetical protein
MDNQIYDGFLSYRVWCDKDTTEKLFYALERKGLRIFWDKECLKSGAPWEEGFVTGLKRSKRVVVLISEKSLEGIADNALAHQDNVLKEIELAVDQLESDSSYVLPLLVGEYKDATLLKKFSAFGGLSGRPWPDEFSTTCSTRTINQTMSALFSVQGIHVDPDDISTSCDLIYTALAQDGLHEHAIVRSTETLTGSLIKSQGTSNRQGFIVNIESPQGPTQNPTIRKFDDLFMGAYHLKDEFSLDCGCGRPCVRGPIDIDSVFGTSHSTPSPRQVLQRQACTYSFDWAAIPVGCEKRGGSCTFEIPCLLQHHYRQIGKEVKEIKADPVTFRDPVTGEIVTFRDPETGEWLEQVDTLGSFTLGPSVSKNQSAHGQAFGLPVHGSMVIVKRSNGDLCVGRVESNSRGRRVHAWTSEDVQEWLEQVGLHRVRSISSALQGRDGKVLLRSRELLQLSLADKEQLSRAIDSCFYLETGGLVDMEPPLESVRDETCVGMEGSEAGLDKGGGGGASWCGHHARPQHIWQCPQQQATGNRHPVPSHWVHAAPSQH